MHRVIESRALSINRFLTNRPNWTISVTVMMMIVIIITACGLPTSLTHHPTTLSGKPYRFQDFPGYMVKIESYLPSRFHQDSYTSDMLASETFSCSGVHIGAGFILTAAHCLTRYQKKQIFNKDSIEIQPLNIRFIWYITQSHGDQKSIKFISSHQIIASATHHQFKKLSPYGHDIAIIKTKPFANFPIAESAHLPTDDYTTKSRVVSVYGIGLSAKDQYDFQQTKHYYSGKAYIFVPYKKELKQMNTSRSIIFKSLNQAILRSHLALPPHFFFVATAASQKQDDYISGVCLGDSGGPIMTRHEEYEQDVLIGLISHMAYRYLIYQLKLGKFFQSLAMSSVTGCWPVFASSHIYEFRDWIDKQINYLNHLAESIDERNMTDESEVIPMIEELESFIVIY
ncbi:MAG: trypsin-like serine protease [Proteobacteria bacterium]|nr:trypsin-like serine protease [Pseudomonadota bacterium]